MFRIFRATGAFFKVLGNRKFANAVRELARPQTKEYSNLESDLAKTLPMNAHAIKEQVSKGAKAEPESLSNDALTFLRALQRDARLVDFLMEDIKGFSDEQVGAAVRDIHAKSADVMKRFFDVAPIHAIAEGEQVEVPAGYDPGLFTLSGAVNGNGPWRGGLQHAGWCANEINIPEYVGSEEAAHVIAPSEVDV